MNKKLLRTTLIAALSFAAIQVSGQSAAELADVKTVTFQQGLDGYEGTFQKRVHAGGTDQFGQDVQQYYLDGSFYANESDDTLDIIVFNDIIGTAAAQIPERATVLDAKLIYHTGTDGNAMSPGPYVIGRLGSQVEEFDTYADLDFIHNVDETPELRASRAMVAGRVSAGYADIAGLEEVSADVTPFVQAWVNGEENFGMTVMANDTTDGWQMVTIGNDDVTLRPRLTVQYTTAEVKEWNFTASQSAHVSGAGTTTDGSTLVAEWLDTDPIREALLQFDELFGESGLSADDQVLWAQLIVQTTGRPDESQSSDSNDPFTVHQLLTPWDVTSNFGDGGLSEIEGQIAAPIGELIGMGENSRASVDVTEIVRRWQAGESNYGFDIRPTNPDGWRFYFPGGPEDLVPTLRVVSIEVPGTPAASFTTSSIVGRIPFEISFDASASADPDGGAIQQYLWDFGNGNTAEGAQVSHIFSEPGIFSVVLTVVDNEGVTAESLAVVRALGAPVAVLNVEETEGLQPFHFVANAAGSEDLDGGGLSYFWSFGNGDTATGSSANYFFEQPGIYTVSLVVTDDEGDRVVLSQEITVNPASVRLASFQEGANGYEGTFQKRVRLGGLTADELGAEVQAYYLDGRPHDAAQLENDTADLIRFDNLVGSGPGQIPANASVVRATLTYTSGSDGNANTDGPYVIGRLNVDVDEFTTYGDLDGSDLPDERGPRGVVEPTLLSGFAAIDNEEVVTADVTTFVQAWVDGEPNQGLAVFTNDTANGWEISTIGNDDISKRPLLNVFYTTNPVKSYAFETVDSALIEPEVETQFGEDISEFFLDGGDDLKEALFKFDVFSADENSIGDGETILSATLLVETGGVLRSTSNNSDTDDPYWVRQMLVDWDGTDPTLDFGLDGITEGVEGSVPMGEFIGMGELAEARADVTEILLNWRAGQPNYGFGVSPGGTDGWQIFFPGVVFAGQDALPPTLYVLTEVTSAGPQRVEAPSIEELLGESPAPVAEGVTLAVRLEGDSNVVISWNSVDGGRYTVESSVDLIEWNVVEAEIASQGAQTEFTAPLSADASFFRVR